MTGTRPPGNPELKALIAESGWSYEQLARAIRLIAHENGHGSLRTNKSAVAHWVAGVVPGQIVSRFLLEALSRRLGRAITSEDCNFEADDEIIGLQLSPDPIGTVVRLGRTELDRRDILAAALYSFAALAGPLEYRAEILARGKLAHTGKVSHAGSRRSLASSERPLRNGSSRGEAWEGLSDVTCKSACVLTLSRSTTAGDAAGCAVVDTICSTRSKHRVVNLLGNQRVFTHFLLEFRSYAAVPSPGWRDDLEVRSRVG